MRTLLEQAGGSLDDVGHITVFIVDNSMRDHVNKQWFECFPDEHDRPHRVCGLFPRNFIGVCQLPQSTGVPPANCIGELRRCIEEFGFVGCNLNPDPSGGYWNSPPLTDRWWFPLYDVLQELDVPAMVHVSASCNPNFHTTGSHYINADTTAFMQLLVSDLFRDFPKLRLIIPHGGGAAPFHWGRYRGHAMALKRPPLPELMGEISTLTPAFTTSPEST